jgi:uncharacterized membrane protein (DUF485 family)
MHNDIYERIRANPKYQRLVQERGRIPIGVGVILFAIIITGIYVHRANTEFDALTEEIIKEAQK